MAIVHVLTASTTDRQIDWANKYNNSVDEIWVSGAVTSARNLTFTKFNAGTYAINNLFIYTGGTSSNNILFQDNSLTNISNATGSAVLAGISNTASGQYTAVVGGVGNLANSTYAATLGGLSNQAIASESAVIGGDTNQTKGSGAVVLGGSGNNASGATSVILGGNSSTISTAGVASVIVGGAAHSITASASVILGGSSITASRANTAYAANFSLEGGKFYVQSGSSKAIGVATLSSGQVTVSNTLVTNSTVIMLTIQSTGGTVGSVYVNQRTAATSFQIKSTSATDSSVVGYQLFEMY